ncbi:MAG: cell division protein FtsZ [Rhodospirillum sp.]|nr:cell division protein FtsZ [Rhodospirillum sp.]MCF8488808.1 cell division protein FtsZ [Rhodospirillum sp.]MCF8500854.1 cell division protein FtsZ [Rhodospirillum sp.]
MAINITVPEGVEPPHLKPRITVIGVGGAGGNAVNNMIDANLEGVDFVVANTDAQALCHSRTSRRIQLGNDATQGLGAGARPEIGRIAAEEAVEAVANELNGANMVFITAGMGGGTGTGAAPVVASVARELGILTVGVVTKPFQFEGQQRMRLAESGIDELAQFVDTLIIIPNQNLFRVANEKTTFADAFKLADDVLYSGVRSVTDLMINPGLINLDFADVRTVMQNMGRAMMGTGEAEGERRALEAAEAAIANPLLEDTSMRGARGVLINITGGTDVTLYEVDEAANRIRDEVETDAHIIFGSSLDSSLDGRIRVSVVATGINAEDMSRMTPVESHHSTHAVSPHSVQSDAPMPDIRTTTATHKPRAMEAAAPARPAVTRTAPTQRAAPPVAPRTTAQTAPSAPAPRQVPAQAPRQTPAAQTQRLASAAQVPVSQRPIMDPAKSARVRQTVSGLESMVLESNANRASSRAQAPSSAPMARRDAFIPEPPMATPTRQAVQGNLDIAEPVHLAAPQVQPQPQATPVEPAYDPRPARDFRPGVAQGTRPQPAPQPEADKTERPSLLARITGLGHRAASDHKDPNPLLSAKTLSANPDDRGVNSQSDDQLEIPAFLRRQAN